MSSQHTAQVPVTPVLPQNFPGGTQEKHSLSPQLWLLCGRVQNWTVPEKYQEVLPFEPSLPTSNIINMGAT